MYVRTTNAHQMTSGDIKLEFYYFSPRNFSDVSIGLQGRKSWDRWCAKLLFQVVRTSTQFISPLPPCSSLSYLCNVTFALGKESSWELLLTVKSPCQEMDSIFRPSKRFLSLLRSHAIPREKGERENEDYFLINVRRSFSHPCKKNRGRKWGLSGKLASSFSFLSICDFRI